MGWTSKQQRSIYRSWAQHFASKRNNTQALEYFDKCIDDHVSDDFLTLFMRSKFNRLIARPEAALKDSQKASKIAGPWNTSVNIQIVDALHDLNQFEENKMIIHNNLRMHVGHKKLPFNHRLTIINENFKDTIGDSLTPFFLKNGSKLAAFHEHHLKQRKHVEPTIRWQKLKERNECDVLSFVEKKNLRASPLETAWSKRKTKVYFQTYFQQTWADISFLKSLRSNPNVVMDKAFNSAGERKEIMNTCFDYVNKFCRMLHARSPIYNELYARSDNTEMAARFHQANMFRIQYQTRRNMISILRTIMALREQEDTVRLRKYVAKVMGEYNVLKTRRVMPWKTEFMNEVYNHLALSLCEGYRLPNQKVSPYDNNSMCHLLGVMPLKPTEQRHVVFGDRSTYVYDDSGEAFEQAKAHKRAKLELEKRLHFSKQPIERSYLLYELADSHMAQNQQLRCLLYAKKSIDEARRCNSKIWEFLATMLQAKSHAILCKFERQAEVLNNAYELAKELRSPRLCTFIELCRMLNKDYMTLRKMSQLVATKRLRTRMSHRSLNDSS
ncbi:uncharacterized protein LOC117790649 [Drosophila innubila]|uniref:uncharacterized protein LOC117790649 n=1 Tax=Drosophila innubila TaxID=198719 RepID=UPI00148B8E87|nr:uncharacterized protein LOC117790649 [Drosophila innubila]